MLARDVQRAFSQLNIKTIDAERRYIAGVATTPTPDRQGDVIDPSGLSYSNPVPLLIGHDKTKPVGLATFAPPTAEGMTFEATLPLVDEPGILKDRVDEAWHSIKHGLMRGVSIGFRALGKSIERLHDGGLKFLKTEVCELSLVTVPANMNATITTIKSLAASGPALSGVADPFPVVALRDATAMPTPTIQEQIQQWANARGPKVARMNELMASSAEGNVTLDEAQADEYDGLEGEVASIDKHIERLRGAERLTLAQATPVLSQNGRPTNGNETTHSKAFSSIVQVRPNVPPGTVFVRAMMCLARAHGDPMLAAEYAKQWHDSTPEVELFLKAPIAPGNTTDPAWAGALATVQNVTGEFMELLRPKTIIGKVAGLRQVPFNASVPLQTAGGTYGWVGQGAPKSVTKLGFGTTTLGIAKAAGIIVLTEELVKLSNPSAEAIVRSDMIAGIAQFLDQQFIDPSVAEVANVSPASITNGTTPITSTGDGMQDLHAIISSFAAANIPLAGTALIMSETNAFTLGMQRTASGEPMFPALGASGGTMEGVQVITSNTAQNWVIGLVPPYILYADDGGVTVDVSREASVQMESVPDNPANATTVLTSLWQNNLVGLRAERFINWKRAKLEAVKYVTGASYTPTLALVSTTVQAQAAGRQPKSAT
jgi:HK97 family phage major capsid protein/HK97 family phage prohead protease